MDLNNLALGRKSFNSVRRAFLLLSSASIQIGIAVQNSVHWENKEYTEVKFLTKKINFRVYFVTYDK